MKTKSISLNEKISKVGLSYRIVNCLSHADIHRIRDLVICNKRDLRHIRNLGEKSITELEDFLDEYGLSFEMDLMPDIGLNKTPVEWQFCQLEIIENKIKNNEIGIREYKMLKNQILEVSKQIEKENLSMFTLNFVIEGLGGKLPNIDDFYDKFFTDKYER
jgi:hypothetical protein